MSNRSQSIDPDPFSLAVGIAGIIGGLASAVELYQRLLRATPAKSHARAIRVLEETRDVLRYLELDVQVIKEAVTEAEISGNRTFRPGHRVFLRKQQFDRYDHAADQILGRLRRVLKITHKIDRLLPQMPHLDQPTRGT